MTVAPLRKWHLSGDIWTLRAGGEIVGAVITSTYGTVSFEGPLSRGTSETIESAKQAVEEQFNPESPMSDMIRRAQGHLREEKGDE